SSGLTLDRFATRPKHSEKRFHSVNAVPEQIGMMRLQLARSIGLRVSYLPDRAIVNSLRTLSKTQRRRTEHRRFGGLGQLENLLDIAERGGHRFINEQRLMRFNHRSGLLKVRTTIDA